MWKICLQRRLFVQDTGYHHGKTVFSAYKKGGFLDKILQDFKKQTPSKNHRMGQIQVSLSSELVCIGKSYEFFRTDNLSKDN